MRITDSTAFRQASADIQKITGEIAKRQREVTTGKRVLAPSDDPSAAHTMVNERAEMGTIDQYVRTADSASARLSIVDSVLSDVLAKLEQASATLTTAQGSTIGQTQRDGLVAELTGIRDSVYTSMTTQFRGAYLFAGTTTTVSPYTKTGTTVGAYAGNAQTASLDIDRQNNVQVTWDGDAVMKGGAANDLFATFANMLTAVAAGDSTAMQTAADELKDAHTRVTRVQSLVGTDLASIEDKRAVLGVAKLAAESRLAATEDTNMVDAITKMTQAESAYEAALTSTARIGRLSLLDYLR
jgi:flagellar hook-associated protein 3 FlgL